MRRSNRRAGMTLIEVVIAITLVGVLMTGMLFAMRISLNSMSKTNDRLIANRRITGAQRILEQQIAGLMPVSAIAPKFPDGTGGFTVQFFQGESQTMRFVSTYSLRQASRGIPHILEFQVIPGKDALGVRLIVNEWPYSGPVSAGLSMLGIADGELGSRVLFQPVEAGTGSFVLADRLAACRFLYQEQKPEPEFEKWYEIWSGPKWPTAVMIEMTPLAAEPGSLKMVSITAPIRVTKAALELYADY